MSCKIRPCSEDRTSASCPRCSRCSAICMSAGRSALRLSGSLSIMREQVQRCGRLCIHVSWPSCAEAGEHLCLHMQDLVSHGPGLRSHKAHFEVQA